MVLDRLLPGFVKSVCPPDIAYDESDVMEDLFPPRLSEDVPTSPQQGVALDRALPPELG